MSAKPPAEVDDEYATRDHPSRSDGFVRGLSQFIGGPLGDHATSLDRPAVAERRFLTAARIVLALICLTLVLHWVQKSPCHSGAWQNNVQYTRFCYSDVLALYYAEGLNEGKVPYRDHPVEYPVLTGVFMGVLGLPVYHLGKDNPEINQGQWAYNVNALVLSALAVATVAVILSLRRRRPWDAALFALSPALLVTATVNWDLLAVGLAAFGLLAWARKKPLLAGVVIGLAGAAKMFPIFILGPILVLGIRSGRVRAALTALVAGLATLVAVNLPFAIFFREGWNRFFELNSSRPIDWGTFWYIGRYLDGRVNLGGAGSQGPFQWLSDNVHTLNYLSYAMFGLACLGVAVLGIRAPIRPRLAPLAFLVVAAFLLTSKVWSQQFLLWLLPLVVLARPKWGAFLAWQFAELAYFVAFYGELLGTSTGTPVFPEGVFVLAAALRWVTVLVLCILIIREVLNPEKDAVRASYPDDPDGGVLDGAPDQPWVDRWRRRPAGPTPTPAPEPAPATT